jgi:hypothetical protein
MIRFTVFARQRGSCLDTAEEIADAGGIPVERVGGASQELPCDNEDSSMRASDLRRGAFVDEPATAMVSVLPVAKGRAPGRMVPKGLPSVGPLAENKGLTRTRNAFGGI